MCTFTNIYNCRLLNSQNSYKNKIRCRSCACVNVYGYLSKHVPTLREVT